MSQNNTIKKSDKKFIRLEKGRIRRRFFDLKKQEEMITELYGRFVKKSAVAKVAEKVEPKIETKKAEAPKVKRQKVVTAK